MRNNVLISIFMTFFLVFMGCSKNSNKSSEPSTSPDNDKVVVTITSTLNNQDQQTDVQETLAPTEYTLTRFDGEKIIKIYDLRSIVGSFETKDDRDYVTSVAPLAITSIKSTANELVYVRLPKITHKTGHGFTMNCPVLVEDFTMGNKAVSVNFNKETIIYTNGDNAYKVENLSNNSTIKFSNNTELIANNHNSINIQNNNQNLELTFTQASQTTMYINKASTVKVNSNNVVIDIHGQLTVENDNNTLFAGITWNNPTTANSNQLILKGDITKPENNLFSFYFTVYPTTSYMKISLDEDKLEQYFITNKTNKVFFINNTGIEVAKLVAGGKNYIIEKNPYHKLVELNFN